MNRELVKQWLPHWKEVAVSAIQAPFPAEDWASMVWLNQDVGIPVIAFEAENRIEIFRSLLEQGALGIMQFAGIAVGGITASLRLIELARVHSVPVTLQCSSTFFAEAVAMQLAACCREVVHVELHQFHTTFYDRAPVNSTAPAKGYVKLPDGNGVGFTPPVEQLVKLASFTRSS